MPNKVGAKGQVVIEKEIRDELGIEPGSVAIQRIVDGHLEIYFLHPRTDARSRGVLRPYIDPDILERASQMDWNEIREEAWRRAVAEDWRAENEDEDQDARVTALLDTSLVVRYLVDDPRELADISSAVIIERNEDDLAITDLATRGSRLRSSHLHTGCRVRTSSMP